MVNQGRSARSTPTQKPLVLFSLIVELYVKRCQFTNRERPCGRMSEQARQQAQAEKLTLRVANNTAGYVGVSLRPNKPKPYQAQVWHDSKYVHLGSFVTAEEAALCIARSPEGQAAAVAAAALAALPLSKDQKCRARKAERARRSPEEQAAAVAAAAAAAAALPLSKDQKYRAKLKRKAELAR